MNFNEYRLNTIRTMKTLGSPLLDSIHMTLGVVSEFLEELPVAINNMDYVNIGEEIGDLFWYLANYANVWGIETADTKIPYDSLAAHDTLEQHFQSIEAGMKTISYHIGQFTDLDKKAFVYNKQVSLEDREYLFFIILLGVEGLASKFNLDSDQLRLKNINKLKVRYPEKFTEESANNRDLKAEYETLK